MIIVSSLSESIAAYQRHGPSHVVSILEGDEAVPPEFGSLPKEKHLELIEDCSAAACANGVAGASRCEKLIAFAKHWDRQAPLLIHCHQGVARSMAAAYIIICAVEDKTCEREIANRLRQAAPHADPNLLLISEADDLLGRDDRMVEAILGLCPSCRAVSAPVVTLPVAA